MRLSDQSFFLSSFFSRFADQVLLFIVPLVVFQSTGSVSWSGGAFFAETLPRFIAFPVCGILCDRFSPMRLLHASQIARAATCVAGVGGYALVGGIGWLIGLSAVCGVLTTQGIMAREVILPRVFTDHPFKRILSYTQIADQLGTVLGPMAASLVFVALPWTYVVLCSAGIFLAADATLMSWQRATGPELAATTKHGGWVEAFATSSRHIVHRPGLKSLVILAAALNLVIGVTLATSAAMVTGVFGQSGFYYAALQTAGAVATVLILFLVAHAPMAMPKFGVLSYSLIFAGGLLTALAPAPWGYAAGFILVVGFDKMFNIYSRSERQKIIPSDDYGKTSGLMVALNNLSQPLAGLLVGLFSGASGSAGPIILACSVVMGLVGVSLALLRRRRAG